MNKQVAIALGSVTAAAAVGVRKFLRGVEESEEEWYEAMPDENKGDERILSMRKWSVLCEPKGDNPAGPAPGKNLGGLVIYLTDGTVRQEVSRVLFVRRNATASANRIKKFKQQLRDQLAVANASAKTVNDLIDKAQKLTRDAQAADEELRGRTQPDPPEMV